MQALHAFSDSPSPETDDTAPLQISAPSKGGRREEEAISLCEAMIDVAAALFNVSSKEMRRPGRAVMAVARVRQMAMYVTHVGLGLTMAEVGRGFQRDRTTVLHACHLIEDLRDDAEFDALVARLEHVSMAAFARRAEIA